MPSKSISSSKSRKGRVLSVMSTTGHGLTKRKKRRKPRKNKSVKKRKGKSKKKRVRRGRKTRRKVGGLRLLNPFAPRPQQLFASAAAAPPAPPVPPVPPAPPAPPASASAPPAPPAAAAASDPLSEYSTRARSDMLYKTTELINEFGNTFKNMEEAGFPLATLNFENCTQEQNKINRSNIQEIINLFVLFKEVLEDKTQRTIKEVLEDKLEDKTLPFIKGKILIKGKIKKSSIRIIRTQFMPNLEKNFLHEEISVSSFFNDNEKTNRSINEILNWFDGKIY